MAAYGLVPETVRIMLRKKLTLMPGIAQLDPILFDRKNKGKSLRQVMIDQKETLQKPNGSVLLFPEGTRSKNVELGNFYSTLYKSAFQEIQQMETYRKKIGIITADTFTALPFGLDARLLKPPIPTKKPEPRAYKTSINFSLDIIDATDAIDDINKTIKSTIETRLRNFAEQRLEQLQK